jgi:hypothetical protein
MLDVAECLYCG